MEYYFSAQHDGGRLNNVEFKVIVSSNGEIRWQTCQIMHSVCRIDVSKFPFDTQKCQMKIGSWSEDVLDVDLQIYKKTNGVNTDLFKENTVWELISARAQKNLIHYKCCPYPYVDITYSFEFRRKPLYYIMTIVFPSMPLSLLTSISFIFPADAGERVSLVISVLLGVVVFMLLVNDRTPVTSDSVPIITQFFNCIGAATVLALLATAFILRLNHVPQTNLFRTISYESETLLRRHSASRTNVKRNLLKTLTVKCSKTNQWSMRTHKFTCAILLTRHPCNSNQNSFLAG